MSIEWDEVDIACIDTVYTPATLISTQGSHCDVWRSMGYLYSDGERQEIDFVLKRHLGACSARETAMLHRHYEEIRSELGLIIPHTRFIRTKIEGEESVLALAETISPWVNVANPANESEVIPLLKKMPRPYDQLELFVQFAERQYETHGRVLDLYGIDNLVLDTQQQIRYMDSFYIYFYEDMCDIVDIDDPLPMRINVSKERLEYLKHILKSAEMRVK